MELFDNSKIASYIDCPRGYFYSWEMRIEPDWNNKDLGFGQVLHSGLDWFYKRIKDFSIWELDAVDNLKMFQDEAVKVFQNKFLELDLPEDKIKNMENGVKSLTEYFLDEGKWSWNGEIVMVEEPISCEDFTGKIDLMIKQDDTLIIIDHKTTGWSGKNDQKKWGQARGLTGYHWLGERIKKEYECNKVQSMVNMFYIGAEPDYCKIPMSYSEWQLKEWEKGTRYWIERIKESKRENFWAKAGSRCQMPRGCEFQVLCEQNKRIEELVIPGIFRKKEGWYC